jgi:hypothetical protein
MSHVQNGFNKVYIREMILLFLPYSGFSPSHLALKKTKKVKNCAGSGSYSHTN